MPRYQSNEPKRRVANTWVIIDIFWITSDSRVSAVLLPALFDRNPWLMFVYDVESFCFLAFNDAAFRAYGYARNAFLALTVLDIRPRRTASS